MHRGFKPGYLCRILLFFFLCLLSVESTATHIFNDVKLNPFLSPKIRARISFFLFFHYSQFSCYNFLYFFFVFCKIEVCFNTNDIFFFFILIRRPMRQQFLKLMMFWVTRLLFACFKKKKRKIRFDFPKHCPALLPNLYMIISKI